MRFKDFLTEKSVSKSQQKLMGMALAYKRGEMDDASDEVKKIADSMSMKDLEDFAGTKHKGLPDKKESVELDEAPKVPAGTKFIAGYEYKDANGNKHSHTHYRKGTKMTDPVVVHIDGKEWKTFQSFTKAKQAAISHIKSMKESVELDEGALQKQWAKGSKQLKHKDITLVRGKSGVHKVMKGGKQVGDFYFDPDANDFEVTVKGRLGQKYVDDIDAVAKMFEQNFEKIDHIFDEEFGFAMFEEEIIKERDGVYNIKGVKIVLKKKGKKYHATMDGKDAGTHDSEKKAMQWISKRMYLSPKAKARYAEGKNVLGDARTILYREKLKRLGYVKEEFELDEATIKDIKDILTTIGSSKNMDQAVQMVMKKYKVDQGKAKAMVKKAIDSGVTYDKIKKKYAKESVESINEAMSRRDFEGLKKGDKITITYDSSIRKGTTATFQVTGRSRSNKYDVDKVTMMNVDNPRGMKSYLYSRSGADATLALGDMGAKIQKYVKESVELDEAPGKYSRSGDKELYQWGDVKKAMRAVGLDDRTTGQVLAKLMTKQVRKESVELEEKDVKVPLELLKLYNKGMALPAGSIEHKKVMKQIDDMRKKLGMKESVELEENAVELARDVVKNKGAKKGLDLTTASVILKVYDQVNDSNKKKMEALPLEKLVNAVWKIVNKAS